VHTEGLPAPSPAQRRQRVVEANRTDKWLHMLAHWHK